MSNKKTFIKAYWPWFMAIMFFYILMALLFWLADIKIFRALSVFLILLAIFTGLCLMLLISRIEGKRTHAMRDFIADPNKETEHKLREVYRTDIEKSKVMDDLICSIYEKEKEREKAKIILSEYEEYVELWAHEIKLPLSLLTLILDNKKEEWSQEEYCKLDYVRKQIQTYISQILFYYRVKKEKQDYFFEDIDCRGSIAAILEDFEPLLQEKKFKTLLEGDNVFIHTDARSFEFIVEQIISNAIKYSGEKPELKISFQKKGEDIQICFKDNGCGVKACDLPHIFHKGFTGDTGPLRKKSTGMGLYLVKQLADKMKIDISTKSVWQEGFEMTLYIKSKRTILESKSKIRNSVFFE